MKSRDEIKKTIDSGRAVLGIELGSTRIKAVLIDENRVPIASGSHEWENRYVDHIWTYDLNDVWDGLRKCCRALAEDVETKYGTKLRKPAAMGVSAMMHGYLPFDGNGELLVPFRTWRNTITGEASARLTELFSYHIPQRWSIAHLYQAILNGEEHVKDIRFFTTLAGYVHWKLTGRKVLGSGDASGMFPVDSEKKDYSRTMMDLFDDLVSDRNYDWKICDLLPEVLQAGESAGTLTEEGARMLDPSGTLEPGIPMCPPEGDAGTGMTATNSVAVKTGNISAGTSAFAMVVLEKELSKAYEEIDMVTTPTGDPVAMVHCNNCTSDLNAWVSLFREFAECLKAETDTAALFGLLYNKALEGDEDCGGLLAYNYFSGEHITGFGEGRPLFVRTPESRFSLANFIRVHLYTSLGALKKGMDILLKEEQVSLDYIMGHGGFFKTRGVGQRILAAAINTPVRVMETAGEGGAWGIALLADYLVSREKGESLQAYLDSRVFPGTVSAGMDPDSRDVLGYERFMERYVRGLAIEQAAVNSLGGCGEQAAGI